MKPNIIWAITWILIIIALFTMTFGIVALILYGICWAFGFPFTLRDAVGLWLVLWLASSVLKKG